MLKPINLWLSGIGRFVERQAIDFRELGYLVQVDGENRNTGGSSGSGKSTVFNALDYLLGLNDLPTTVLQSRLTKDPIEVVGVFDWDGKQVEISRSKKGLKITINGVVTTGSSKITEEKLDEILGMPRHLFRKMLHKRQKEGGFFLDFTPKEMHEFLTDAIGLANIRSKTEILDRKLKELETQKVSYDTKLASAKSALCSTQDAILAVGLPPIQDIHQPIILELKRKYDDSNATLKNVEETHGNETKELEKSRPSVQSTSFDLSNRNGLEKSRRESDSAILTLRESEKERQRQIKALILDKDHENSKLLYSVKAGDLAASKVLSKAEEIKKIRAAICPTCEQSWLHDSAKIKEGVLLQELTKLKEEIAIGKQCQVSINENLTLINQLHTQTAAVVTQEELDLVVKSSDLAVQILRDKQAEANFRDEENAKNKTILDAFAQQQVALRNKQALEANQARGQVDVSRRAFEAAVQKLKSFNDARDRYESTINNLKLNVQLQEETVSIAEKALANIGLEITKCEELKKALKSFLSCSFDEALEGIGDTATRIIRCIPNMSNATLQFEGLKETKEGKVKEEVNAVISMDGEIGIPIKSLSGGERSSVDLAVDLAVIDFIEHKTNKGISIFILDEPFTGLDTVSIEMALEVLKNSNINKKLIIVDHNPEVKQMVTSRFVVVRNGQTSTIEGNING